MDLEELRSRMSPDVQCYAERIMDMYNAPFARFLGIDIVSVTADSAECSMTILPEHMNSMARAHGGTVYTVMDHAFGVAANLRRDCTGSSAEIKYYRPSSGRIRAVATVINRSRSMEMYDVRAYSEEGKLLASMTCTAFAIKRDRYGRQALPLLRRAGAYQLDHLPEVLQEDPRGARPAAQQRRLGAEGEGRQEPEAGTHTRHRLRHLRFPRRRQDLPHTQGVQGLHTDAPGAAFLHPGHPAGHQPDAVPLRHGADHPAGHPAFHNLRAAVHSLPDRRAPGIDDPHKASIQSLFAEPLDY